MEDDTDAETEAPPVEQLAQQQDTDEDVVIVQVETTVVSTVQGHRVYLKAVDDKGRMWERDSTMPAAEWHRIVGPRA